VRIVLWNIRAGGGCRADAIASQLAAWQPDVVALCEFRATPPSAALARALVARGLTHQRTTAEPALPGANRVFAASRWPLRRLRLPGEPREPGQWLLATVDAPARFTLGVMHVPNRVTGRKDAFYQAVLGLVARWRAGPALLVGDTNTGQPGLDEESPVFTPREAAWLAALARSGWTDGFRHLRGAERAYTWYSPNAGNGFRLDQAFVNRALLPRVREVCYRWGGSARRRDALSDHAALLLDLVP
jgi:exonuclease III